MARRPFDPAAHGWRRTTYVRGDILDRNAVARFVAGADVVVHLAFLIFGDRDETRKVNLEGSRNVFEATVAEGIGRLVYTSSVAAYGFHADNPQPLTEDVPVAGSDGFYYSAQKAELEGVLTEALAGTDVDAYIFRPSIVAGPDSPILIDNLPYVQASAALPQPLVRALGGIPYATPVLPDFGTPLQLVHADDVATALRSAVKGAGEPGIYNLAAAGELTFTDIAREIGWRSIRVPRGAVDATAAVLERIPRTPAQAEWIHTLRIPVLMSTARARSKLRWRPAHDAAETFRQTVEAAREAGKITSNRA